MAIGLAMAVSAVLIDTPAASAATTITSAKKAFIASLVGPAQNAQRKFGVPASVSIAQAIEASDWGTSPAAKAAKNYFNTRCSASMTATQFARVADAQVNKPYVLGAEVAISNPNPAKFDCSELVEWLYGRAGTRITDLAAAQYNATTAVPKGTSPKVGDLVFLRNNPARANGIGHVAVLTQKMANGDWRIIEARGRAYGVVRSTLSYWKTRSYYAGLRRYVKLVLAGSDGVTASAAISYQSGCVTLSSTRYSKFASITDSFAAHAAAVAKDSAYKAARAVMASSVPKYVDAVAKAEHPKDAAAYAKKIKTLIDDFRLRDHDVAPLTLVLRSGDRGAKVSAAQYLLTAAGYSVKANGNYDSATVAAVKKFQSAKKITTDGEAGPITLGALMTKLTSGSKGNAVSALHTLLRANGHATNSGSTFGATTLASVKAVQATVGRPVSGTVDANTWAALFMTLNPSTPTISGTATVGQQLTAVPGTWGPGSVGLSYQWYRGDTAINSATKSTYTPDVADAGFTLRVVVTGTKPLHTTTSLSSAAVGPVPLLTMKTTPTPTITGTAQVGEALTAVPGTWVPDGVNLSFQWYRGGTAITGATKSTYLVQPGDALSALKVAVTGSTTGYKEVTKTSAATSPVVGLIVGQTPTITGTATVGKTLTAVPGAWEPAKASLAYQWYRGNTAINGATKSTYTLQAADAGATLKVTVTGTLTGYLATAKTSAVTGKIAKGKLTAPTAKIQGTAKAGKTLTAVPGTWGPATVKLSYQWFRGTTAIQGATGKTYLVKTTDKGKTITVRVRGTKSGYTTVDKKASVKIAV